MHSGFYVGLHAVTLLLLHCVHGYRHIRTTQEEQPLVYPSKIYADFAVISEAAPVPVPAPAVAVAAAPAAVKENEVPCRLTGADADAADLYELGVGMDTNGMGTNGGSSPGAGDSVGNGSRNCNDPSGGAVKCDVKSIFSHGDPKQKSSSIALKAAQDARAASEAQQAAGQLAAQHIKQELAEKAFQSAKAAEAALTGKQLVVQQLEMEMQEMKTVVEEESNSLQHTNNNMNAAVEAARVATQQFEALSDLQKSVKENLANIQSVALGAEQELTAKVQLLEAAKNRMAAIEKQLLMARDDYEKTKQAAYRAACAAVEAKQKASQQSRI